MDQMRLGLAKEQKIRHAGQNPVGLSQKLRRSRAKEFGSILDLCEIFSSDHMTSRRVRLWVQVSVWASESDWSLPASSSYHLFLFCFVFFYIIYRIRNRDRQSFGARKRWLYVSQLSLLWLQHAHCGTMCGLVNDCFMCCFTEAAQLVVWKDIFLLWEYIFNRSWKPQTWPWFQNSCTNFVKEPHTLTQKHIFIFWGCLLLSFCLLADFCSMSWCERGKYLGKIFKLCFCFSTFSGRSGVVVMKLSLEIFCFLSMLLFFVSTSAHLDRNRRFSKCLLCYLDLGNSKIIPVHSLSGSKVTWDSTLKTT